MQVVQHFLLLMPRSRLPSIMWQIHHYLIFIKNVQVKLKGALSQVRNTDVNVNIKDFKILASPLE